jgi:hypothetical protein
MGPHSGPALCLIELTFRTKLGAYSVKCVGPLLVTPLWRAAETFRLVKVHQKLVWSQSGYSLEPAWSRFRANVVQQVWFLKTSAAQQAVALRKVADDIRIRSSDRANS